ncbi:MAG: hypothetical protein HC817_00380 [Saprospiraceae bacterium]|nr:hypothetical protein [Saprospiraceae bacterium]
MKKNLLYFLLACSLFDSCASSNESSGTENESFTSGEISISVDETLRPIADAEVDVFAYLPQCENKFALSV